MKDFTIYEYQERLDRMTELLSEVEGWGQAYQSSMGQTLIQLMTDVTDTLHYMLERRTVENYLDTAKLRTSVIARACELGYRYKRAIANNGYVEIKISDVEGVEQFAEADVVIPAYTEIVNDGVIYTIIETAVIPQGSNTVLVKVKQGTATEFEAEIDDQQTILITDFDNIENTSLLVHEGGVEYKNVATDNGNVNKRALSFAQPDERFYDIKYSVEGMRIIFGDDFFGKKPESALTIKYIEVDPTNVPINTLEQEFQFDNFTVTDVQDRIYNVELKNTTPINGYKPVEDIESIKRNTVIYHKTNGRATTNEDYSYWVERSGIGNIVDTKTIGEQELESLVYNLNNVYITYLKEDGTDLTIQEHELLREYMDNVKTSQAHMVFNPATKLQIQLLLEARKHPTNPISNEEFYDLLRIFCRDYFALQKGSIGREVQSSDIIYELYRENVTRNGLTYPLIDYAKINLNGVFPFTFPLKTDKVFIELAPNYTPVDNDRFTLLFQNLICEVLVDETDTSAEILTKMRDRIHQVTPFDARVVLAGVALDPFGNPLPLEINPAVGATMLIGTLTPYESPTNIIEPAAIGSTLAVVKNLAPSLEIQHFYYSSLAGRRPMIPLRIGTDISFTAPTDTDVRVYTRLVKDDPSTETLVTTITAGQLYEETFTEEHILQFEYVNDSEEDVVVDIYYGSYDGSALGLIVESKDQFGTFTTITSSGDLSDFVSVDYSMKLPVATRNITSTTQNLYPNSVKITNPDGNVVLKDDGTGGFVTNLGVEKDTGRVNYITGEIILPKDLAAGEYLVIYDQNRYDNFKVDGTTAIELIQPKPSLNSTEESITKITVI